jgi:hypothetical protein
MDAALIDRINLLYPLLAEHMQLHQETEEHLMRLVQECKQKFDARFRHT